MNGKDLKVTAVANEVYNYLTEMCQASDIDVADLIRELAGKQQLVDTRSRITTLGCGGVNGEMSNDHSESIVMDKAQSTMAQ